MGWLSSTEDVRSERYDLLIYDESGEPEPAKVEDAKDAALPTMDVTDGDDPLFVVAGTAGRYRDGNLLWDYLQRLIDSDAGGLGYAFPEGTDLAEIDRANPGNWPHVAELLSAHHPGVGNLTSLDRLYESWKGLRPESFLREYGSLFGTAGTKSKAISPTTWHDLAAPELPQPPANFVIGVATHVDQRAASVVAAWRESGKAHLLLLGHGLGTQWLVPKLLELGSKYRVKIVHDASGPMRAETMDARLKSARLQLEPLKASQVTPAAALLVREIDARRIVHYDQPELNDAANHAVKRQRYAGWSLASDEGFDGDVTAIEAASFALLAFDSAPAPRKKYRPS
jgi:hypothetical protein